MRTTTKKKRSRTGQATWSLLVLLYRRIENITVVFFFLVAIHRPPKSYKGWGGCGSVGWGGIVLWPKVWYGTRLSDNEDEFGLKSTVNIKLDVELRPCDAAIIKAGLG